MSHELTKNWNTSNYAEKNVLCINIKQILYLKLVRGKKHVLADCVHN